MNQSVAGFLNSATNQVNDIGIALNGFLDVGLSLANKIKSRIPEVKETFSSTEPIPISQNQKAPWSFPAFNTANTETLLIYGSVGVIAAALLFRLVK